MKNNTSKLDQILAHRLLKVPTECVANVVFSWPLP